MTFIQPLDKKNLSRLDNIYMKLPMLLENCLYFYRKEGTEGVMADFFICSNLVCWPSYLLVLAFPNYSSTHFAIY